MAGNRDNEVVLISQNDKNNNSKSCRHGNNTKWGNCQKKNPRKTHANAETHKYTSTFLYTQLKYGRHKTYFDRVLLLFNYFLFIFCLFNLWCTTIQISSLFVNCNKTSTIIAIISLTIQPFWLAHHRSYHDWNSTIKARSSKYFKPIAKLALNKYL